MKVDEHIPHPESLAKNSATFLVFPFPAEALCFPREDTSIHLIRGVYDPYRGKHSGPAPYIPYAINPAYCE